MYAIIKDVGKVVIGVSDGLPNSDDLDSRGEFAIATDKNFNLGDIYDPLLQTFSTPAVPFESLQATKLLSLKQTCSQEILSGVICDALDPGVTDYKYPTTRDDQANLDSEVTTAKLYGISQAPYHFWCVQADQAQDPSVWARVEHTALEMEVVGVAVRQHIKAQQTNYEIKRAAALAALTVEELDLVVW